MRLLARNRWLAGCLAVILLLAAAGSAAAQADGSTQPPLPPAEDYKNAQVVSISMGQVDNERGIRVLGLFADGGHEAVNLNGSQGRRTLPPDGGGERFFYFDIHDTYVYGGANTVELTITYLDLGLGPIVLDYDAVDPQLPQKGITKRVQLAAKGNTESWKTIRIQLQDARFAGGLGGADFRVGGTSDLILRAVGVFKLASTKPQTIAVLIDGQEVSFTDAYPFISRNRVLVPLRAIFEALGAVVQWYGETQTIEATRGSRTIRLKIGDPLAFINLEGYQLDVPAAIVGGRTYVPLRFVGESFGLRVDWNGETQTVSLFTQATPVLADPPPDEEPPDEQPPDEQPPDEQPPDEQPPDEQPPGEEPPDEEPPSGTTGGTAGSAAVSATATSTCDPTQPWWRRGINCPPAGSH